MRARPRIHAGVTLPLAVLLAACGSSTQPPVPASISVSPAAVTLGTVGATRQLSATVRDASGSVISDATVSWGSSDIGVAGVSPQGLVTAVSAGTAIVTATSGAASANTTVTVSIAALSCTVASGNPVNLAVGQLMLLTDPSAFCLSLPAGAAEAQYLIGVQSTTPDAGSNPIRVTAISGTQAAPAAAPARSPASTVRREAASVPLPRRDDRMARRIRAWYGSHARQLQRDVALLRTTGRMAAPGRAPMAPQAAVVKPGMSVGDTVTLRVRKIDQGCGPSDYDSVKAKMVYKGQKAWWFDDTGDPPALTTADWKALADRFDQITEPTDTHYFGQTTDKDGNGVIVVLFTKVLNQRGADPNGVSTLGFVSPCDFYDRSPSQGFAASNEGEFFYHIAADPNGQFGDTVTVADFIPEADFIIAHEFSHIIQFSRRLSNDPSGNTVMDSYIAEGQATLAEEVVGHAVLGNSPGQNYDAKVAFNDPGYSWYSDGFLDLFSYWGVDFDASIRIPGTPERCSWTVADPSPCKGRALWYGVSWSLLRWINDQFGPGFSGGEAGLQRQLTSSNLSGLDALASVTGKPVPWLLGHWAPMLYMDDRPLVGGTLDSQLQMTSWNLYSMYNDLHSTSDPALTALLHPAPTEEIGGDWQDDATVKNPSFAWYLVSPNGSASAIRVTDQSPAGNPLQSWMQIFVVRTK